MSLYQEAAYSIALEGIAAGATRDEVRGTIHRSYPLLTDGEIRGLMAEALDGALSSGIEREDVDESWL